MEEEYLGAIAAITYTASDLRNVFLLPKTSARPLKLSGLPFTSKHRCDVWQTEQVHFKVSRVVDVFWTPACCFMSQREWLSLPAERS